MDVAKLKEWMQVVGIFSVVASLIFVGVQIRQDQRLAEAQSWSDQAANQIELAQLVAEHRDVWVRGLAGEELSHDDALAFSIIARAVAVKFSTTWQRANRLATRPAEGVIRQAAHAAYLHPGIRREWINRCDYSREIFGRHTAYCTDFLSYLEKLDSGAAPAPKIVNETFF